MKTITIGDVHGRPYWKQIDPTKYDRMIFVGDFTDSSNPKYSADEIISNLKEIIELKKSEPEKVVLIPGNHCLAYIFSQQKHPCSRHLFGAYQAFHEVFEMNADLFTAAYQIKNYLWTHAGVMSEWLLGMFESGHIDPSETDLATAINRLYKKDSHLVGQVSGMRGGRDPYSGPFWADMDELFSWQENKPLAGYHQIVGHNRVPFVHTLPTNPEHQKEGSITFTDCQDKEKTMYAFYELEIQD